MQPRQIPTTVRLLDGYYHRIEMVSEETVTKIGSTLLSFMSKLLNILQILNPKKANIGLEFITVN